MNNNFLKRAVDPKQYDFSDVFWDKEISLKSSPTREWFWEYLKQNQNFWLNKDVLDIGCGTGWSVDLFLSNGAKSVQGFDPSEKSVRLAHTLHPDLNIRLDSLESFSSEIEYDFIVSIMSFGHIENVEHAFQKVFTLLKPKGRFLLFVPNYDYFKKPRYNYQIKVSDINDGEYVAQILRPHWGTIAEIVRKTSVYKTIAEMVGFGLVMEDQLKPTENLIKRSPYYEETKNDTLVDLFIFRK